MLNFAEDVADVAQATFVNFLAQQHDHKAAQIGESVYSNGSVSLDTFPARLRYKYIKQVSLGISLFYDGPEPPEGLYDELLALPTTSKSIFNGSFTDFILSQFSPTFER